MYEPLKVEAEAVLQCSNCMEEIECCDNCGEEFRSGDEIICYYNDLAYYHFCSEECYKEFIKKNELSDIEEEATDDGQLEKD